MLSWDVRRQGVGSVVCFNIVVGRVDVEKSSGENTMRRGGREADDRLGAAAGVRELVEGISRLRPASVLALIIS